jgi:hypothetical protein
MIKIGQVYQTTVKNFDARLGLTHIDQQVKITEVDEVGDGWSNEVAWNNKKGTWCVVTEEEILVGKVVLIN